MPLNADRLDGYVLDVAYPDYFHRELMPLWLTSAMQALGRRTPDLQQPFTWLELGCGTGISAVVAAATHPAGRFIGLDANPRAIAQAQALAQAAGLGNVQFICADFAQALQPGTLPACDFIVSHGVYSWVSPHNRQAMQQVVQALLQPGGICYLAYMSQPGSATMSAAQKLAQLYAGRMSVDSATQAQHAIALLQRVAGAGTGYFAEHPRMAAEIGRLGEMDARYIAHEFLNTHWDCLHVADVIRDMQSAECEFAGSATLLENVDAASLPQSALPLLQELAQQGADACVLETFKDIARNQNEARCDKWRCVSEINRVGFFFTPRKRITEFAYLQTNRSPIAGASLFPGRSRGHLQLMPLPNLIRLTQPLWNGRVSCCGSSVLGLMLTGR